MKKVVVGLLIVFAYLAAYLYININVSGLVALVGSLDLFFDAAWRIWKFLFEFYKCRTSFFSFLKFSE